MGSWSHQLSMLSLDQSSEVEPDSEYSSQSMWNTQLSEITVYLRYCLEIPLLSEGFKSRLNRSGP